MVKTNATSPLISYSSYSPEVSKLFAYLINKSEMPQQANTSIEGYRTKLNMHVWVYAGESSDDMHPAWRKRKKSSLKEVQLLNGSSITVYELCVKQRTKD